MSGNRQLMCVHIQVHQVFNYVELSFYNLDTNARNKYTQKMGLEKHNMDFKELNKKGNINETNSYYLICAFKHTICCMCVRVLISIMIRV